MPSWFKKVFKSGAAQAPTVSSSVAQLPASTPPKPHTSHSELDSGNNSEATSPARRVVHAPLVVTDEERSGWSDDVRIKARVERDMTSCVFLVDRPVFEGFSAWFPQEHMAKGVSALAEKLFDIKEVGTVLLHDMTVTITLAPRARRPWEDLAKGIGQIIRTYLIGEQPVISEEFLNSLPSEESIERSLQTCIELEVNPGIAAHSGLVTLNRIVGNTVYITMGGACQGCAASAFTLREGIHTAFRQSVPQIGAIYDETDHAAGKNPYFKELPAGME